MVPQESGSRAVPQKAAGAQAAPAEGFAIQQVRECWEKVANAGRVDLWLSGHTHRVAYLGPVGQVGRMGQVGPAGPATNRYHLVVGAPDTFTRVDVAPTHLTVTVTRETGETLQTVTVR